MVQDHILKIKVIRSKCFGCYHNVHAYDFLFLSYAGEWHCTLKMVQMAYEYERETHKWSIKIKHCRYRELWGVDKNVRQLQTF